MKLGTRHAGIRIERAMWGMPARVVVYGGRDPFAGPGGIPWRFYWSRDLRAPLKIVPHFDVWIVPGQGHKVGDMIGLHLEYGCGKRRRVSKVLWFPFYRRRFRR